MEALIIMSTQLLDHFRISRFSVIVFAAVLGAANTCGLPGQAQSSGNKTAPPNFLVVVADDLGYADIGSFGGEIDTPNLDKIANMGMRLASFYTTPACASTRAALMTGADNHAVGMGSVEFLFPQQRGQPGYELRLSRENPTIAERLREQGYDTIMSGKWHLGKGAGETPHERGFTKSFALLEGGHNHFDAMPLSAHGASYREQGESVEWPQGAYSTDQFTDKMIEYLTDTADSKNPFFAYLAYTAPHWPLQAPAEDIEKYRGKYDRGPRATAAKRLERQKRMGIFPAAAEAHPFQETKPWENLSESERAFEARKMEVYAAMVDRLDRNFGRIIDTLSKLGTLENTYIIFFSDNGAEGMFGDQDGIWGFEKLKKVLADTSMVDNSLDNLGAPDSLFAYGSQWAQTSEVPFRRYKSFTTEGGIRNAAIVAGPGIAAGEISDAFVHVMDIAPTLLSLASPDKPNQSIDSDGAKVLGRDWTSLLHGERKSVYGDQDVTGWELFGGSALRRGKWKITYVQKMDFGRAPGQWGPGNWQLFDIVHDPGETLDLSRQHPALKTELVNRWIDYARENGVILLSPETQQDNARVSVE